MTVAIPGRGLTQVSINTSKIQERAMATRAVYEHANALGASFGRYCQDSFNAFVPSLRYPYSSEIRSTAAQTLSAIYEASCALGEERGTMEQPLLYLPVLVPTIASLLVTEDEQQDIESLYAIADSLSDILCSTYSRLDGFNQQKFTSCFSLLHAQSAVEHCITALQACLKRRGRITCALAKATSDDEREDCTQQLVEEDNLFTPLVDSIGYNLKIFKEHFVPIFESLVVPTLSGYLSPQCNDIAARVSAVCLFDDCIEHCGAQAAAKFSPILLSALVSSLDIEQHGSEDLVRVSLYGVAQVARYAPAAVFSGLDTSTLVARLFTHATGSKENPVLFQNAISALASTALFDNSPCRGTQVVKWDRVLEVIMSSLPISEDEDEARICHEGFCDLLEAGRIGLQYQETIVRIIGETLAFVQNGEEVASPETCLRLTRIWVQLQQMVPQDDINRSFSALEQPSQDAINAAVANNAHLVTNVVSP